MKSGARHWRRCAKKRPRANFRKANRESDGPRMNVGILFSGLALGIFLVSGFDLARADEPTEQIRAAINKGVHILQESHLDVKKDRPKIIQRLREIVYPLFDFKEMAKRSLGSHWREITAQQQDQFCSLVTDLLEKTYADKIDLYDGQKVIYTQETIDKDFAQVDTKVVGKNGESFLVSYRMTQVDGR